MSGIYYILVIRSILYIAILVFDHTSIDEHRVEIYILEVYLFEYLTLQNSIIFKT